MPVFCILDSRLGQLRALVPFSTLAHSTWQVLSSGTVQAMKQAALLSKEAWF
jgi:hypothetical protein